MNYPEIYRRSLEQPESFWLDLARTLPWKKAPERALAREESGVYRWFPDGIMNTSYWVLDHHILSGRGGQVAIHYDSPVTHTTKSITYSELQDQVARFAGGLQRLGVKKGDRVLIYMPMVPEVVVAMLACARLGAIHSVVFGGFAPKEVAIRIDDARPKVILIASAGVEVDRVIPYLPIIRQAVEIAGHKPDHTVILSREVHPALPDQPGEYAWSDIADHDPVDAVPVASTDPLYILYTSGTTGKPKGIVRDHGGHAVALFHSMRWIYGMQPGETFWAASDVGWVVGHSYIVYAPLLMGCSTVLYEGKPVRTPDAGAFWRVINAYQVRVLFTAPTAIRAIKKEDQDGAHLPAEGLPSLRHLFLAGERTDVATWQWAGDLLGIPVIDHWWQTESGWPMLASFAGLDHLHIKPGSAGHPVYGYDIRIVRDDCRNCGPGEEGTVVVRLPLPPGCLPTLWGSDEGFRKAYLETCPDAYFTGDGGYRDEDGNIFITGRIDDIINVAGHRLSTASMEEVLSGHPMVAECAVIGVEDKLKGHVPMGFVVMPVGVNIPVNQLERELIQRIREEIGAVASFKRVVVVERLPKTRSGKILRKVMRSIADGRDYQVPSTIEDPGSLDLIHSVFE